MGHDVARSVRKAERSLAYGARRRNDAALVARERVDQPKSDAESRAMGIIGELKRAWRERPLAARIACVRYRRKPC